MSKFLTDESLFSNIKNTIDYINNPINKIEKVTFIVTSNRYKGDTVNTPKSTIIAQLIKKYSTKKIEIIDINDLKIHTCEGNVSSFHGNNCGVKKALLKDKDKNPNNILRCWASVNNKDDELYKVVNSIMSSQLIVFFTSVRWGQTNSQYQKLIERLTWLENRHSTLKEDNILKNIQAGIVVIGHNFNGNSVLDTQRQVLQFYGFKVQNSLCWNHQYLNNITDESQMNYKKSNKDFFSDLDKFIKQRNPKPKEDLQ